VPKKEEPSSGDFGSPRKRNGALQKGQGLLKREKRKGRAQRKQKKRTEKRTTLEWTARGTEELQKGGRYKKKSGKTSTKETVKKKKGRKGKVPKNPLEKRGELKVNGEGEP